MPADPPERDADQQPSPSTRAPKVDSSAASHADTSKHGNGAKGSPQGGATNDRYASETAHATPNSTSDEGAATAPK